MDLIVSAVSEARWDKSSVRCALGWGGVTRSKREGDGATPIGTWPLRRLLYRADRIARPQARLETSGIRQEHGWCDDPADPAYNRPVTLPYAGRHERLARDEIYDLILVLGYNDDPVVPGLGSAIFLPCCAARFQSDGRLLALARADLVQFLAQAQHGDSVIVEG